MPKEVYGLLGLVSAGFALFLLVGYLPPYSTLADLQIALWNTNWVTLSLLVTWLVVAAPLFVPAFLIEKCVGTRRTWFTPVFENLDHTLDLPPGKLLLVGATLFAMGAYFSAKDLSVGPQRTVKLEQLERGEVGEFSYVRIGEGNAILESDLSFKNNGTLHHYIPVTGTTERPSLFLRVEKKETAPVQPPFEGLLERSGLEGEMESLLRERALLPEVYYVLRPGAKPQPALGFSFVGIGLALIVGALTWWRVRYVVTQVQAS